ncbi:MAG TPA: response regulator [Chloroflexia bacterium]|nr:response regulator [Chloroflexia bacterium]
MSRILVVDDEPLIVEMVEETLLNDGHEVIKAYSGEEALEKVDQEMPDLVLLDLMLPGMDGYEVSRQMQKEARFNHIPIIMLTAKNAIADRVTGYERGADDYITKPFDADELLIRVRSQLQHLNREDKSSLTGLPGSRTVEEEIEERTGDPDGLWSIVYIDIEHFTAYNEVYSFAEGDELIRLAAKAISQATREMGNPEDFVGHIGGDDFVVLTTPDRSKLISDRATALFAESVPSCFNATDRTNGYFVFLSHNGESVRLPLVSLSFDIVDNEPE